MRRIGLNIKTKNFNSLPTPSSLVFTEPKIEDDYSFVHVTGADDMLWEYILSVVNIDEPEIYQEYIDLTESEKLSILSSMEAVVFDEEPALRLVITIFNFGAVDDQ